MLVAVVPHAMKTSRPFAVAEIHGAHVPRGSFADANVSLFQPLESAALKRLSQRFVEDANVCVCLFKFTREHEFISATKIGRLRDIAVVTQLQRNADIHVTLAGS